MKEFEEEHLLLLLDIRLQAINDELDKYKNAPYLLIEAESIGKMRRYGKEYYETQYLKNSAKNYSDFMKTFLYLKSTEFQLHMAKKDILNRIKTFKENLNEDGRL